MTISYTQNNFFVYKMTHVSLVIKVFVQFAEDEKGQKKSEKRKGRKKNVLRLEGQGTHSGFQLSKFAIHPNLFYAD